MAETRALREQWLMLLPRTALVGTFFGALAAYAGIPLPWMLGSLFGAAAFSLSGVRMGMPGPLRQGSRIVIGLILGASIDAETLSRVTQWPLSLTLMFVGMSLIILASAQYYRRVAGFDRLTAVSASLPGGLSNMTAIAIQLGADGPGTVVGQLFRLTSVVMLVPPLYIVWMGVGASGAAAGDAVDWWGENLWVVLFALPGVYLTRRLRMPVPELLGPMLVAAAWSMSGFHLDLPFWAVAAAFVVLGTSIGARFHGLTLRILLSKGGHSLVATFLVLCGTFALALAINALAGIPLHVALLAVMPGGIAEMTILAAALGVDPVFVAFHQAFRSITLNAGAPFLLQWLRTQKDES